MIKKTLITLLLCTAVGTSQAAPYFRAIDPAHPQTSLGLFSDYKGHSATGGVLALVTHSPVDGCLIPSICEGWAPLTVGGTLGAGLGGRSVSFGSGLNMLPAGKATALTILNAVSSDSQFSNLKTILAPPKTTTPDLSLFVGPQLSWVFKSLKESKIIPTLFAGGTLLF